MCSSAIKVRLEKYKFAVSLNFSSALSHFPNFNGPHQFASKPYSIEQKALVSTRLIRTEHTNAAYPQCLEKTYLFFSGRGFLVLFARKEVDLSSSRKLNTRIQLETVRLVKKVSLWRNTLLYDTLNKAFAFCCIHSLSTSWHLCPTMPSWTMRWCSVHINSPVSNTHTRHYKIRAGKKLSLRSAHIHCAFYP